jgi:hypothetical protein
VVRRQFFAPLAVYVWRKLACCRMSRNHVPSTGHARPAAGPSHQSPLRAEATAATTGMAVASTMRHGIAAHTSSSRRLCRKSIGIVRARRVLQIARSVVTTTPAASTAHMTGVTSRISYTFLGARERWSTVTVDDKTGGGRGRVHDPRRHAARWTMRVWRNLRLIRLPVTAGSGTRLRSHRSTRHLCERAQSRRISGERTATDLVPRRQQSLYLLV